MSLQFYPQNNVPNGNKRSKMNCNLLRFISTMSLQLFIRSSVKGQKQNKKNVKINYLSSVGAEAIVILQQKWKHFVSSERRRWTKRGETKKKCLNSSKFCWQSASAQRHKCSNEWWFFGLRFHRSSSSFMCLFSRSITCFICNCDARRRSWKSVPRKFYLNDHIPNIASTWWAWIGAHAFQHGGKRESGKIDFGSLFLSRNTWVLMLSPLSTADRLKKEKKINENRCTCLFIFSELTMQKKRKRRKNYPISRHQNCQKEAQNAIIVCKDEI